MGQYFRAVDKTKKEVVCPYCLGGIAKLWEWAVNPWGAVFVLLLRRSDGSGGGDYYGYGPQIIEVDAVSPEKLLHAISKGVAMEGKPIEPEPDSVVATTRKFYAPGTVQESAGLIREKLAVPRNSSTAELT